MAIKKHISINITLFSESGYGKKFVATQSSTGKWGKSLQRKSLRDARGNLRSAAAYARKIMRNSIKKGRVTKAPKTSAVGRPSHIRSNKKQRIPSQAGKPPKYFTVGKQWGIRTIVFTKLDRYGDSYAIGAKRFQSKQGKYSRFVIPEMLEFGGTGKVKTFANKDNTKETKSLWSGIAKSGGKVPTVWKSARYKPRPYASIVLKPTLKKFNNIYGR